MSAMPDHVFSPGKMVTAFIVHRSFSLTKLGTSRAEIEPLIAS